MALAYTAPTWEDGSGTGISASQLQALCNCVEGLVQGSDKAIHSISMANSVITVVYADGTQENVTVTGMKGVSSVELISRSGIYDTYRMTFTDGTFFDYTIVNGTGAGDMLKMVYDPDDDVADAGGIPSYVSDHLDEWTASSTQANGKVAFDNLDPSYGYKPYFDSENATGDIAVPTIDSTVKVETGTATGTIKLTYTVTGGTDGTSKFKLRIMK